MERMAALEPLFVDVTWGAGGSTSDLTLAISANAQKYLGVEVLMHLTCTNLKVRICPCASSPPSTSHKIRDEDKALVEKRTNVQIRIS